jgi:hypothetical protein
MHHIEVVIAAFSDVELDHIHGKGKSDAKGIERIFECAGRVSPVGNDEGFGHEIVRRSQLVAKAIDNG